MKIRKNDKRRNIFIFLILTSIRKISTFKKIFKSKVFRMMKIAIRMEHK